MLVPLPRLLILVWLIALLLAGCTRAEPTPPLLSTSSATTEPATPTPEPATIAAEPTATNTPAPEPTPTDTPEPEPPTPTAESLLPTPTDTPEPAPTSAPPTPTPTPETAPVTTAVSGTLTVYYLDVGQGDSTLLMGPDFTILIDAGRHDRSDVVPHLEQYGVESIDLLIGTHPHADHIGQMDKVLQRFPVGEVWMSGGETTSLTYERVLDAIDASDAGYHEPRAGEVYDIGSAVVEVVNPSSLINDLNEDSVSVRVLFGEIAFLFTGDAESQSEAAMVASGHDLRANVLQLGHHGSRTSSTRAFLEAVQPEVAIWSASEGNSYGHPHGEVIARLADMNIPTYGTAAFGTIVVATDGRCYDVTVNGARAPPIAQQSIVNETTELRDGAGTQFNVADILKPCMPVIALGRNQTGDWLLVETFDGQQGWVAEAHIQHVDVESLLVFDGSNTRTGVVNGNANLRGGPGTTFDVVGSAAPGSVVETLGRNEAGDWLHIEMPDGQQAWIAAFLVDYVEVGALPVLGDTEEHGEHEDSSQDESEIEDTTDPVNINTAPHEELRRIIHIGPDRAEQMLQLRPFTSVDDMVRISGIGPSRLADIKAQGLAYVDGRHVPPPPPPDDCGPGQVNINMASHQELQAIIHIGPARADQMLQLRQSRPFSSVDDMTRISGIAAARLADIKTQGLACAG